MPIDYKQQFINDIGFHHDMAIPYMNQYAAIDRITAIYGTARVGRLSIHSASQYWNNFFSNIWNNRHDLQFTQEDFDNWHKEKVRELSSIIANNELWRPGIAQKMFNLFLKDLWAWREIPEEIVGYLHAPLDRIILARFRDVPQSWQNWTKVVCGEQDFDEKYGDYMHLQNTMRAYFNETGVFNSPIEMEQFLWHQF